MSNADWAFQLCIPALPQKLCIDLTDLKKCPRVFAPTTPPHHPLHFTPSLLLNHLDASEWRGIFRWDVVRQIGPTPALFGEWMTPVQPCVSGVFSGNKDCSFYPNWKLCRLSLVSSMSSITQQGNVYNNAFKWPLQLPKKAPDKQVLIESSQSREKY